jgi:hypothetical protein
MLRKMGHLTHYGNGAESGGGGTVAGPRLHVSAARKLRRFGATDADLAEAFDISLETLSRWRAQDPEFAEASKDIEDVLTAQVVDALYMRAVGYTYEAEKVVRSGGVPMIMRYSVHVPPNVPACEFWLTNRRPDQWRYCKPTPHASKNVNDPGGKTSQELLADLYDRLAKNPIPRPPGLFGRTT